MVGRVLGLKLKFWYKECEEVFRLPVKPKKRTKIHGKKVWALETGELFDSVIDASRKTGAHKDMIYRYVEHRKRCPRTGLTFVEINNASA